MKTAEPLEFLREHDRDAVQGFLFSPPVPGEALLAGLLPAKGRVKASGS